MLKKLKKKKWKNEKRVGNESNLQKWRRVTISCWMNRRSIKNASGKPKKKYVPREFVCKSLKYPTNC